MPHLPVSSETLIPELAIKNAEPNCVPQQTSEHGVQALNLINVTEVASESTPARDTGLQVALAQEPEAANIECTQVPISTPSPFMAIAQEPEAANNECTQVPITDAVDFCSSLNPSKRKAKSTRKRKANKGTGGKATFNDAKGTAGGKEGQAVRRKQPKMRAKPQTVVDSS